MAIGVAIPHLSKAARLLLAATLILGLGLAVLPSGSAHASNSGQTWCLKGYNYANPSTGYLFSASEGLASACAWVHTDIRNNGSVSGSGFGGGRCFGTQLSYAQASGYVATDHVLSSGSWNTPCTNHYGAPASGQRFHDWGALYVLW